ncbi:MAG TPA: methionyl-tRNA formyltransferase [Saprospiraceae bacterium]|nr:methionyl-tRNA formyltransferase [Saprospiraceae bacterium]HMV23650.1 methionyl-tRNA formyltransferase [Saprospiraceae bacterium]HMW74458.1 methionyl-tRNA formyltransferase [Saprospiraceae bacterium]HMX83201.1 methionyl-tRNA formyltransferase [Saprospiraceae bacterium]HMX86044.1 methionyl-tRNA formyltransferase [Saprospiraceae bacterium]
MRIVFMGTPDFAVASLDILVQNGYDIAAVITAPDRLGGRGMKQIIESPVKKYAVEHNIRILQPEKLRNEDFLKELKELNAELQIVVAFRMLPEVVWNMPPLGTFNLHASLLPKYRGAAPINWAIINGEKTTGCTTFFLTHEIDTGNILLQNEISIDEQDTAGSLHDKLMTTGANLVLQTVRGIESQSITPFPQTGEPSLAPKIFHDTCRIDWNTSVDKAYDFIRGLSPYPGAWTTVNGVQLKIYETKKHKSASVETAGKYEFLDKKVLRMYCNNGYLEIISVQAEGKRRMSITEYLNGLQL